MAYRVRTAITGGPGGPYLSQMWFTSETGETAQEAADAVRAFWDSLKAWITDPMVMTVEPEVVTFDVGLGIPTGVVVTSTAPVNATSGSAQAPSATQGLISWRTGVFVGSREIRGRTFVPGVPQSSLGDGLPGGAYVAALNTAAAALVADANTKLSIHSPSKHELAPAISGNAWGKFAVLRSRRD